MTAAKVRIIFNWQKYFVKNNVGDIDFFRGSRENKYFCGTKFRIMVIASQKRKENIAEYILYMWQIEDLIRANNLDIDLIEKNIISKYTLSDEQYRAMYDWYESLIDMMHSENVVDSGHLQLNKNILIQLAELHSVLLKDARFSEYSSEFYKMLPYIVELRSKAGDSKTGEIETCFTALYGTLMLRLKGDGITDDTLIAIKQISRFLALLSHYYKLDSYNQLFKDND